MTHPTVCRQSIFVDAMNWAVSFTRGKACVKGQGSAETDPSCWLRSWERHFSRSFRNPVFFLCSLKFVWSLYFYILRENRNITLSITVEYVCWLFTKKLVQWRGDIVNLWFSYVPKAGRSKAQILSENLLCARTFTGTVNACFQWIQHQTCQIH